MKGISFRVRGYTWRTKTEKGINVKRVFQGLAKARFCRVFQGLAPSQTKISTTISVSEKSPQKSLYLRNVRKNLRRNLRRNLLPDPCGACAFGAHTPVESLRAWAAQRLWAPAPVGPIASKPPAPLGPSAYGPRRQGTQAGTDCADTPSRQKKEKPIHLKRVFQQYV